MATLGMIVSRMRAAGESQESIDAVRAEYERVNPPKPSAFTPAPLAEAKDFLQKNPVAPVQTEPGDFFGGFHKSLASGEALRTGLEAAPEYLKGAILDIPSTLGHFAKDVLDFKLNPGLTALRMGEGLRQIPDIVSKAGSEPKPFGRMMGQMFGQPAVMEGAGLVATSPRVGMKVGSGIEAVGRTLAKAQPTGAPGNIPVTPRMIGLRTGARVTGAAGRKIQQVGENIRLRAATAAPSRGALLKGESKPTETINTGKPPGERGTPVGGGEGRTRPRPVKIGEGPRRGDYTSPIVETTQAAAARTSEPRTADLNLQEPVSASPTETLFEPPDIIQSNATYDPFSPPEGGGKVIPSNPQYGPSGYGGEFEAPGNIRSINLQEPVGAAPEGQLYTGDPNIDLNQPVAPPAAGPGPRLSREKVPSIEDQFASILEQGAAEGAREPGVQLPIDLTEPVISYPERAEPLLNRPEGARLSREKVPSVEEQFADILAEGAAETAQPPGVELPPPPYSQGAGAPPEQPRVSVKAPKSAAEGAEAAGPITPPPPPAPPPPNPPPNSGGRLRIPLDTTGMTPADAALLRSQADRVRAALAKMAEREGIPPEAPPAPKNTPPPAIPASPPEGPIPSNPEINRPRRGPSPEYGSDVQPPVAPEGVDPVTGEILAESEPTAGPTPTIGDAFVPAARTPEAPSAFGPRTPGSMSDRVTSRFFAPSEDPGAIVPPRPVVPPRPRNPLTPEVPEGQVTNRQMIENSARRAAEERLAREAREFGDQVLPNEFGEDMLLTPDELRNPEIPEMFSPVENPYDPRLAPGGVVSEARVADEISPAPVSDDIINRRMEELGIPYDKNVSSAEVALSKFESGAGGDPRGYLMDAIDALKRARGTRLSPADTKLYDSLVERVGGEVGAAPVMDEILRNPTLDVPGVKKSQFSGANPPQVPIQNKSQFTPGTQKAGRDFEIMPGPSETLGPPTPIGQPKTPGSIADRPSRHFAEGDKKYTVKNPNGEKIGEISVTAKDVADMKQMGMLDDIPDSVIADEMYNNQLEEILASSGYKDTDLPRMKIEDTTPTQKTRLVKPGEKKAVKETTTPVEVAPKKKEVAAKPAEKATKAKPVKVTAEKKPRAKKAKEEAPKEEAKTEPKPEPESEKKVLPLTTKPGTSVLAPIAKPESYAGMPPRYKLKDATNTAEIQRGRQKGYHMTYNENGEVVMVRGDLLESETMAPHPETAKPEVKPVTKPSEVQTRHFDPDKAFAPGGDPEAIREALLQLRSQGAADERFKPLLPTVLQNRKLQPGETWRQRLTRLFTHPNERPGMTPERAAEVDKFVEQVTGAATSEHPKRVEATAAETPLLRSKDVKFKIPEELGNRPHARNRNWVSPRQEEILREMRKRQGLKPK